MGFALTPHPDPGTGSAKRPDFLVTGPDGSNFFLEAVLASERNGANPAAEAMKQTTLDMLDRAPHTSFLIDIETDGDPTTQPSGRELIRYAHAWLDSLNYDELLPSSVGSEFFPGLLPSNLLISVNCFQCINFRLCLSPSSSRTQLNASTTCLLR